MKKIKKPKLRGPRKKRPKPVVNAAWFRAFVKQKGLNLLELSKRAKMHPSTIHQILSGKRALRSEEAVRLADILTVQLETVLENFGISVSGVATSEGAGLQVELEGYLDGMLTIRREGLAGPRSATYPFGKEKGIRAVKFQTFGSEFGFWDNALLFFREQKGGPDAGLVGKLNIIEVAGSDTLRLRELRRGYKTGKWNLAGPNGRILEEDVAITKTFPVLWIRL